MSLWHPSLTLLLALGLSSCASYQPLNDAKLRQPIGHPFSGLKVTFLGNTTFYIDDGQHSLLIDGFVSRPGILNTLLGKIGPDPQTIKTELENTSIKKVNAILVGHAHHDHSLDATYMADLFETTVIGSKSFAQIYCASHDPSRHSTLKTIPTQGGKYTVGRFEITFSHSAHVGSHASAQTAVEGHIIKPLRMPAHYSRFNCGDVYIIRIAHPHGTIVVTTTAGAQKDQLRGQREADVIFLGVGMLAKETPAQREAYWHETVAATTAKLVVPVHWDDFARKLSRGLKPSALTGSTKMVMDWVVSKAALSHRQVRVLDVRESLWLKDHQVFCP